MLPYIVLIIGFGCLIVAADYLVAGSSALARRMNVSDLVIGLTVVAFGTSTPELFVNLVAAVRGNTDIALNNVVGSNIANILLILGISAMIAPLAVSKSTVWKEIPFSLLAALALGIAANDRRLGGVVSVLTRGDGFILLCFFSIFLYYSAAITSDASAFESREQVGSMTLHAALLRVAGGLAGLMLGGYLVVGNAIRIADSIGMSEALIGLTIVAVGTSLPELATSAMASYRGNADIAVGNVVGSNIFNVFFILGVTTVIRPITYDENNNVDLILLAAASFLLFFSMFTGKKRSLDRWEGMLFVAIYIGFIGLKIAVV